MIRPRSVPDIVILPAGSIPASTHSPTPDSTDERRAAIETFFRAKSYSANTLKNYRQDFKLFLEWTELPWTKVTSQQMRQFKVYLMRVDLTDGRRILSNASVRRIFRTLKTFLDWMVAEGHLDRNPAAAIELPVGSELQDKPVERLDYAQIINSLNQAATQHPLQERHLALIALLQHVPLRTVAVLNIEHYQTGQLQAQQTQIELSATAQAALDTYLAWRSEQGDVLLPHSPLFVSHSRRNRGDRLGVSGIEKAIKAIAQAAGVDVQLSQLHRANLLAKQNKSDNHHLLEVIGECRKLFEQAIAMLSDNPEQNGAEVCQILRAGVDRLPAITTTNQVSNSLGD